MNLTFHEIYERALKHCYDMTDDWILEQLTALEHDIALLADSYDPGDLPKIIFAGVSFLAYMEEIDRRLGELVSPEKRALRDRLYRVFQGMFEEFKQS